MVDFVPIAFALVAPLAALELMWSTLGRTWALSPALAYGFGSVLFINAGYLAVFASSSRDPADVEALLSVSLGLLAVGVGVALGNHVLRADRRWRDWQGQPVQQDLGFSTAVVAAALVFAVVLLYFYLLGYVPLFRGLRQLLQGGFVAGLLNTARISRDVYVNPEATYIPLQGLMEAIRYFGLPVVAVWFLHFLRAGVQRRWSALMLGLIGLATVLSGQRWPLMHLLASLLLYSFWTYQAKRELRASVRRVLLMALLLGLGLSTLLSRRVETGASFVGALSRGTQDLALRVLFGNVVVPYKSYALFPESQPFLLGGSWVQNLASYLPGPLPSFPVTFYQMVTGDERGFTAPPDYYAEAYLNFGWPGVVLLSFLWGIALVALQHSFAGSRKSLVRLSYQALMTTLIAFVAMSGVSFLLGGLIVLVFVTGCLIVARTFTTLPAASPPRDIEPR